MPQNQRNNGYHVQAKASGIDINIYGDIGGWDEDNSVQADKVVKALRDNPSRDVNLYVNSYGGSLADGLAIHGALLAHQGSVRAVIDGIAYSVASMIPAAADSVEIAPAGIMMIHAPWIMAIGNAPELRVAADALEKNADAMEAGYLQRSSIDRAEIATWLRDGEDHFLTASEALDKGYVDRIQEKSRADLALVAMASQRLCKQPTRTEVSIMASDNSPTNSPDNTQQDFVGDHIQAYEAGEASGAKKNQRRINDVRDVFAGLLERDPGLSALANSCERDIQCTREVAQERVLAYLRNRTDVPIQGAAPPGPASGSYQPQRENQLVIKADQADKLIEGGIRAIEIRAGIERDPKILAAEKNSELLSMSLLELGKHCMRVNGMTPGGNIMQVAHQVLAAGGGPGLGTDHFPAILENVLNKQLQAGYDAAAETWSQWTVEGRLNDFRPASRVNKSLFDLLEKMEEFEKFRHGKFADVKEEIQAHLHGKAYSLSYQALINDDLNALVGTAADWGISAAKTIGNAVYLVFTAAGTGGYGQIMLEDGTVLFHANHNNLVDSGSGGDPDETTVGEARSRMITQMDPNNQMVAAQPRYLIHSTVRTMAVRKLLNSQTLITGQDITSGDQNPVATLGLMPVEEYRLDGFNGGTPWYLAANRGTVEVAYLNGQRTPMAIRTPMGEIPGITWQVSMSFGVGALDWRTMQMNYGSSS